MKIIFLGTPSFAVPSLDILYSNGYTIPAVITAPGKPAGRGLHIKHSPVKIYADEKGIKTFQPLKLNDPEFIAEIKNLEPDLMVVVAFRMLPEMLWQLPRLGTFNLHGSLLPQYRGAAPINRAIMNGETETGVTTFFLKHEIDTGNVVFRKQVPIMPNETAGELHDKMMYTGAKLVLDTVQAIEAGSIRMIDQHELISKGEILKPAPKIFPADCQINWQTGASIIHNQVRGLSPFPGAFTYLVDTNGNRIHLKIYRTLVSDVVPMALPGEISIQHNKLFICCAQGVIEILELQQEGKKKMSAADFIKGFRTEKGWKAAVTN